MGIRQANRTARCHSQTRCFYDHHGTDVRRFLAPDRWIVLPPAGHRLGPIRGRGTDKGTGVVFLTTVPISSRLEKRAVVFSKTSRSLRGKFARTTTQTVSTSLQVHRGTYD